MRNRGEMAVVRPGAVAKGCRGPNHPDRKASEQQSDRRQAGSEMVYMM